MIERDEKNVAMRYHYDIIKSDFARAGEASSDLKRSLRQLGIDSGVLRKVAIATYEAEINVVIHSEGGAIDVYIKPDRIEIYVSDEGPGIEDIELAMTAGYSTATSEVREMGFGAGMGLPNIKRYADGFFIASDVGVGTNLKIVMNL